MLKHHACTQAALIVSMHAGVSALQTQFVRYVGCKDAATSSGWLLSESTAAHSLRQPEAASTADAGGAAHAAGLPGQVQMSIVAAPAELCLPIKKDRVFKPAFQVQVPSSQHAFHHSCFTMWFACVGCRAPGHKADAA